MKQFKDIRSKSLGKVKKAKVFADKHSCDNKKSDMFDKKGKLATKDAGDLSYGADKNDVKITEDIDAAYSDWQNKVKTSNPEHADKIKFKADPTQRHVISAQHGDRSFGVFDMHKGEGELLGEEYGYRSTHRAPMGGQELSAPLHKMDKIFPADIYSKDAARLYGHGGNHVDMDKQTMKTIHGLKGSPDATVDIHRAVPSNVKNPKINNGDWVTINKNYAKEHGNSVLNGKFQIVSKTVPAKHVFSNGDSIHEYGYDKSEETNESAINELTKSTLVSYIKKAATGAAEEANVQGFKAGATNPKYNTSETSSKEKKRLKGIETAAQKLATEEVEMKGSIDQDYIEKKINKIAKKHNVSAKQIKKQLMMGAAEEKEHTDDMDVATKIALDHLGEVPDYYSKLKKVEESTDKEAYQEFYKREAEVRRAAHDDGVKFAPKSDQIDIRYPYAIAKGAKGDLRNVGHHVYKHEGGVWKHQESYPTWYDAFKHVTK